MATNNANFDIIKTLDFVRVYESETGYKVARTTDGARAINGNVCPLCNSGTHKNKTGAFSIYPATQSFYCYSCNAGGSVIDFAAMLRQCSEREAGEYLNNKYFGGRAIADNMDVAATYQKQQLKQQPTRSSATNAADGCKVDREVNAAIMELVTDSADDPNLLAYLDGRGITADIRARWCIKTFAASSYYTINTKLKKLFPLDRLRRAGVLSAKDNFLFCYHRIMLFNRNNGGEVLNIKARAVPGDEAETRAKYMNQHGEKYPFCTSSIYAARPGESVAIVEGEFDAIALNELGNAAVAVGGVGDNQTIYRGLLSLIARRGLSAVPCFDNDEGGRRAETKFNDIAPTIGGLRFAPGRIPSADGCKDFADVLQRENVTRPDDLNALEHYLTRPTTWRVDDLARRENLTPLRIRRAFMDFVKCYGVGNITFSDNYEIIYIN